MSAIAALTLARMVMGVLPFARWRRSVGLKGEPAAADLRVARKYASHVDRASKLLPFRSKCLSRAVALGWILRRKRTPHVLVMAVRPANLRGSEDDLHAWVEVQGEKVIGDLSGPWIETFRTDAETGPVTKR